MSRLPRSNDRPCAHSRERACEGIQFLRWLVVSTIWGRRSGRSEPGKTVGSSGLVASLGLGDHLPSDRLVQAALLRSRWAAIRLLASACNSATPLALISLRTR